MDGPGNVLLNEPGLWLDKLPRPTADGHKYDRGHCVVLSGGAASTGAARLAAGAALRIGAGLVTVLSPPSALLVNACHLTAVMLRRCASADELKEILGDDRIRSVIAGPGLGRGEQTKALVQALVQSDKALVLDADALTAFRDDPQGLLSPLSQRGNAVLTPHEGEFARLFGKAPQQGRSRHGKVTEAAEKCGAAIVLKGQKTLIATPGEALVENRHASPFLATAGSGDVLAGAIGGLIAQGMAPHHAACAAVWLHGEAGRRCGPGMISEDLDHGLRVALADLHQRYTR